MSTEPYLETACSKRETICLYSSTLHDWKEALLFIICIIRRSALKNSELNWRVPSSYFDLRSSFLCSLDVDVTNYNVRAADGAVFVSLHRYKKICYWCSPPLSKLKSCSLSKAISSTYIIRTSPSLIRHDYAQSVEIIPVITTVCPLTLFAYRYSSLSWMFLAMLDKSKEWQLHEDCWKRSSPGRATLYLERIVVWVDNRRFTCRLSSRYSKVNAIEIACGTEACWACWVGRVQSLAQVTVVVGSTNTGAIRSSVAESALSVFEHQPPAHPQRVKTLQEPVAIEGHCLNGLSPRYTIMKRLRSLSFWSSLHFFISWMPSAG